MPKGFFTTCAFFVEKCIPFMNSALWGPRAAPNKKWHKIKCTWN
jgi:hypothetical protein